MRFFLTAAVCRLKLSLGKSLIAAMLLFVIALWLVSAAFGERQQLMMNVGILYPDTPYAVSLADSFEAYSAGNLAVIRYPDMGPMLKDVANGRLECAYLLPEEYKSGGKIEMFTTPDSIGPAVSNLLMAATYMQAMAADLGYRVLRSYLPADRAEIAEAIAEKNESYLSLGAFMDVEYQGFGRAEESSGLYYALNGTAALFCGFISMLFCLGLVREGNTALGARIEASGGGGIYFLGNLAAVMLLNLAFFGGAGLVVGRISAAPVVLAYCFFVSAFSVCLGSIIKSESLFMGIAILGFLCTAVLGGVFIDIGELVSGLDWVKYFFASYYFMEGLKASASYMYLAAAGAVMALWAAKMSM